MRAFNQVHQLTSFLRRHKILAWLIFSAILLFGLSALFSHFPSLVEKLYTQRFYAVFARMITALSAALPFSLSEISLYLGIISALVWVALGAWRRRFGRTLLELLAGAAGLLVWFYLAWGFNYLRPKIEQQLHLSEAEPDSSILRENFLWCIENANAAWQPLPTWNLAALDEEIEQNYAGVFAELNMRNISGRWPPKFLLLPQLLDYTLTSGIFGPFFHEVHLNSHLLPVEMPFVLAHEKAHGRGFARESEASFIAALVCLRSKNSAVHYSAYFALLRSFRTRYRQFARADSIAQRIRPEIIADFEAVWNRIEKYLGPLAELSQKSYDFYLRVNQVEGGTKNYSDVVDLVIGWREKRRNLEGVIRQ